MKLKLKIEEIASIVSGVVLSNNTDHPTLIHSIFTDTRKITFPNNAIFCALGGNFYDGHSFINHALSKGINCFIVSSKFNCKGFENVTFIQVDNTLNALLSLAEYKRTLLKYPIIAITGDLGKTTIKEWLFHFLSNKYKVSRSPKSYNSTIGICISILELTDDAEIGIIEVSPHQVANFRTIEKIIQPNIGIISHLKSSRKSVNTDLLFKNSEIIFTKKDEILNDYFINSNEYSKSTNLSIVIQLANYFKLTKSEIQIKINELPVLALRMEEFTGVNQNTIINDSYNLDHDALIHSLNYQLSTSNHQKRILIIGIDKSNLKEKPKIDEIISTFNLDQIIYAISPEEINRDDFNNCSILIKGTRKADMQRIAHLFRLKSHKTILEIDLSAIKYNLAVYKSNLNYKTKVLMMLKSNAYGTGVEVMGKFFQELGVDYIGVAYADEGVELRKNGVHLPILVMNAEEESFDDCINYQLEPAIFSFEQLDNFIKELINYNISNFPIHIKINTGMNRLGFEIEESQKIIAIINSQPEVKLASIYSHLADADNEKSKTFTVNQISKFEYVSDIFIKNISYPFMRHVLNSEATQKFPEKQFEMVRLGIGVYGYSNSANFSTNLRPSIFWKSSISQIRHIKVGESIGYGRSFIAEEDMQIGIVPVGYADGFRRCLSDGIGGVFIQNIFCRTLGKVCMDMIMVDLKNIKVKTGESVEIIGFNQSINDFSKLMDTIPYEIMTNFSKRVHRVYLSE